MRDENGIGRIPRGTLKAHPTSNTLNPPQLAGMLVPRASLLIPPVGKVALLLSDSEWLLASWTCGAAWPIRPWCGDVTHSVTTCCASVKLCLLFYLSSSVSTSCVQ